MGTRTADEFLEAVLGDEGWQEGLAGETIEAVIAWLEARFPPGAAVDDATAEAVRRALRGGGDVLARLRGLP